MKRRGVSLVSSLALIGSFSPATLGAKVWVDPSDLSTLKQERTGASATTPAVVDGVVGSVRNKGSAGGWFVAAADSRRPVLRSNGTLCWLEFDGADDYLSLTSPALDLATIEVFIGARILGSAGNAAGMVTFAPASGGDFNSNTALTIYTNYTDYDVGVVGGSGSTLGANVSGLMLRPHVIELHKPDNTSAAIVVDNATAATDSVSSAFTTMGGDLLLGARYVNGINTFATFALYSLVVTNSVVADKTQLRQYMETKTGNNGPVYPDIADLTELADARDTLIGEVFATAGGVLPTDLATLAVETPHPLNGIVTLTNLASCHKMTIPGYAARPRLWTPNSARSDVIVLLCAGHSVAWNGNALAAVAMQTLLTANIRVCTFVLPNGPNDYTSGGPADHESNQTALSEWVGPVVIAINKLLADYPGAQIYIAGISGGGWMANICGACDVRIEGTYHFVGTLPDYIHLNRDWEQRLPGLTADYLTLYLLGACPGRRNKQILYENDPVGFNRAATNTRPGWSVQLAAQAAALGGGDYDLAWVNYNQHAFEATSYAVQFVAELPAP